jgi:hypothetical protein
VQFELQYIETVVNEIIFGSINDGSNSNQLGFNQDSIDLEVKRIKNAFACQVIYEDSESRNRRYFDLHCASLIGLSNKIYDTFEEDSHQIVPATALLPSISKALEDILSYIKNNFPQYFNDSLKAPKTFVAVQMGEISERVTVLHLKFQDTRLPKALFEIIFSQFKYLNPSDSFSYTQLAFFRILLNELFHVGCANDDESRIRQNVCRVLIECNFNHPFFFGYYIDHFNQIIASCETLSDRIETVAFFYKEMAQINVAPGLAYIPSLPLIKDQLLEWLSCELEYLRQKQLLNISSKDEAIIRMDFRLNFNLSVAHLAYLFKAFIETGIILNKNTSELIRFLTKFVKTKKSEAVSFESFRIKFYNTESGTKDAVKKTLQSLLNYINKN